MNHKIKVLFVLISMSFLFVGCAHYNLAKDGAELATAGNHWGATKKYFESLEKKPGYEKALDGLKLSALPAYKQKLEIAGNYEKQTNYETAAIEYCPGLGS